jgi:hypothetical protein
VQVPKRITTFFAVVLFATSSILAANPKSANTQAAKGAMMQMPLVVPLFVENDEFKSTLGLVNGSAVSTYADVMVRDLDGKIIASQRAQFSAHSQQRVDLGALLRSSGTSATTGSILIMQSPDLKGTVIAAALSITYVTYPEPNYIDEEVAMPSAEGSQVLRAVADKSDGPPVIAIASLAESAQNVRVDCLSMNGRGISKTVTLAAGETLFTPACEGEDVPGFDLQTALDIADKPHGPTGIALSSDGMPGSFAAFALAPHGKPGERYLTAVPFADPKMVMSANTVFAGVPVGTATLLPAGKYVPEVSFANFSGKDAQVKIQYSRTSADGPKPRDVANFTVPAKSTRSLTMNSLEGDPELRNSFVVVASGAPGDLLAKLVSRSDSRLHAVELVGKDEKDPDNGGEHPWTLEDGTESTLLLFNHSSKPQFFTVLVSGGGVLWQKTYQLQRMQTKAIGIGALIENQEKDEKGRKLPRAAKSGLVSWVTPDSGNTKGRILQSNLRLAMARNFSCGDSIVPCGSGGTMTLSPSTIGVNATASASASIPFCYANFSCSGTFQGDNFGGLPGRLNHRELPQLHSMATRLR